MSLPRSLHLISFPNPDIPIPSYPIIPRNRNDHVTPLEATPGTFSNFGIGNIGRMRAIAGEFPRIIRGGYLTGCMKQQVCREKDMDRGRDRVLARTSELGESNVAGES